MEHTTAGLPPSKRPRKAPRLAIDEQEPSLTRARQEMAALVGSLARGHICSPAWSCTNLLALPTPAPPPAPSLLGPPYSGPTAAPSIIVSHMAGSPTSPKPRLTFTLDVPPSKAPASISHLDFSPCGCYLLAVTTSLNEDVLTVFEQRDGCINNWAVCWSERVERFGEDAAAGSNVKRFIGVRWIGEPRNWFPASAPTDGTPSKRPIFCAPPRSPPVRGAAFIIIMSSSELLFIHLPRNTPLLPLTVVLPLHPPPPHLELALSALPTAPTYSASTGIILPDASPQTAIDALVANLVDGMPSNGPSPSVVAGALGLGNVEGATGGDALKEELRAAEAGINASKLGMKRRVLRGAVGVARSQKAPELGETLFLIATTSKSTPSPSTATQTLSCPPPPPKMAQAPTATMLDLTAASSPDDFANEFTDFSALDEAFGGPLMPAQKSQVSVAEAAPGAAEGGRRGDDDQEQRVDLCELRVQMNAMEGPRLMIRPLPPVHVRDPIDVNNTNQSGSLTHLEWLEDIELPRPDLLDSQAGVDLRLLVVSASDSDDDALPSSSMTSWAFSNEPVLLSEAFGRLESKKGDATSGAQEWTATREASTSFEGLIPFVHSRAGPVFGSFGVGETRPVKDGVLSTRMLWLNSSTLEPLGTLGETQLPGSTVFSAVALSANRGLLCATPYTQRTSGRPVLAATPLAVSSSDLPSTLASRLVIALARQLDSSDLIGRVIGLKDDAQTLAIVRQIRDTLQSLLPPPRQLENSALMLELLGLTSTLYCASPTLLLRGTIASDIIKLATLVRAFRKCEKKERGAPPAEAGYRCESDAVWPLIGHATWYCDFARQLAKESASSAVLGDSTSSPRHILLLHPFVRSLHSQAVECILGLQAFLSAFPVHQNFVVDTAKTVLDDTIDFNGLVLSEWKNVLSRVGELQGASGDSPELRDLLITFSLNPPLSNASPLLSTLLSAPTLFLPPSLPTPPPETAHSLPLDIIKRNRLVEKGDFKVCLRCGERSEKRVLVGNETGRWTAFEVGWEGRCACGGAWVEEIKGE